MTVLEEDPAALQDLGLVDELVGPWALALAQGHHVQVQAAAAELLGQPHQLGGWVHT